VEYMVARTGQVEIEKNKMEIDTEELELELIDHGLEDLKEEEDKILLLCDFTDYGTLQQALETNKIEVKESELLRIPSHTKSLSDEQVEDMIKLVERLEEDEDVVNVFHNMDESE